MRVFHFMKKEHALSNVLNSRLKIATINELNDPFEFYANFTEKGKPLPDNDLERIKSHYSKILGFLCFSKKLTNPVQWAHYAEKHNGICFEFNIPKNLLLKMHYRKKPLIIKANSDNWQESFVKSTKSKFKHWQYEKEYRMLVPLSTDYIVKENNLLFMSFSELSKPVSAYLGLNCKLSSVEKKIFRNNSVELIKTKKCSHSYAIVKA